MGEVTLAHSCRDLGEGVLPRLQHGRGGHRCCLLSIPEPPSLARGPPAPLRRQSPSPAPRGCGSFKGGWGRCAGRVVSVSSAHAALPEPVPVREPPRLCRRGLAELKPWEESGSGWRLTLVGLPGQPRRDPGHGEGPRRRERAGVFSSIRGIH